jgi:Peptidase family M23
MGTGIRLKKTFASVSFLLLCCLNLFAQRIIEVKYEPDSKGGYVFSCFNNAYCNYILAVGFTSFENEKADRPLPFHAEVKPGYNKLFTITPVRPQDAVQFKYNSSYQKGCIQPVVDRDFTYLFPITPGMNAQVYEMSPDKSSDSATWYVLRVKMKPGDTIYASRKGIVNVVQDQNGANDAGQASIGAENYIEITQPDCSFARYGILKKNSAMVKPGQAVKAGQPVGLVGGDQFARGSEIRFSVYYYQEDNDVPSQSAISHYVVTQIWTKNNGKGRLKHGAVYTSEFPVAVLNQEMPVSKPVKGKQKKAKS